MRSSFRDSFNNSLVDGVGERRTVIVERHNGSFGFTLQSYGIHYRDETDVEIITYVDFVDPNGYAHKAGLRPGDVIVSINGQEVERSDHSALVATIQSCPDRIRMVVIFENCVRKVELHMKYIQLTQLLEAKARDYQEICASERAFITRLNKTRAAGSYYTLHHSSEVVMRRGQASSSTTSYSSKSLPRPHQHESLRLCEQLTSSGSSGKINQTCTNTKRRSYLCIGKAPDCDCCFRPEGSNNGSQSGTPKHHPHSHKHEIKPIFQRPRSMHLSCYKNPADVSSEERYLIHPSEGKGCQVYAGYGFGYEFSHPKNHNSSAVNVTTDGTPKRRAAGFSGTHKSAEDLSLSSRLQNQCRFAPTTRPVLPQRQWSETETSQIPLTGTQQLDSISFYSRPPQPMSTSSSVVQITESHTHHAQIHSYNKHSHHHHRPDHPQHRHHHDHSHRHTLNHTYHPGQHQIHGLFNSKSHQNYHMPIRGLLSSSDEGGFDEAQCFRTLPSSSAKKTILHP